MGSQKVSDETRTIFVVESEKNKTSSYAELFSGKYDIIKTKIDDNCIDILKKHFSEISLIFLDASDKTEESTDFIKMVKSDRMVHNIPVMVIADDSVSDEEETFLSVGAAGVIRYSSKPNAIFLQVSNIIELKENAENGSMSELDALTGLYTRQAFFRHAEKIISENPDFKFIITISELEGIKLLNEKDGKQAGDSKLKAVANFLRNSGDSCLLAGRFGGDQFVALFRQDDDFEKGISMDDVSGVLVTSPSEGVEEVRMRFAIYENVEHDVPVSVICDRALLALQTIRGKYGKRMAKYEEKLLIEHERKERIEECMREALENNQFRVYYQPKHDANTGELTGAEALIRWEHPEYGFMSPGEFIPIFEDNGFITEVDSFVWKKTCENLHKWIEKGLDVVPVSINASKLDFMRPDFFEKLNKASTEMDVPSGLLHIEVTESLFSDQIEELVGILSKCQENGYKIELDDFGSGYSSLNTLSILPLDVVKMDMSLVKAITDFKSMRVFSACINLARSLGLKTVSEGVETKEQMWAIRELGGDVIQGYYYSKPLSEEDFEKYLSTHR
ncbi:MAG: bifunctional diguanylate cyclase/phosphodiesterase [Oscillospiraceae bacterium]|nr:bifunctional diguanylate cyclase/phosphodiesterase [Oscillospiraceae bacterium]